VEANVTYPTDSGLLAKAVLRIACLIMAIHAAGVGHPDQSAGPTLGSRPESPNRPPRT